MKAWKLKNIFASLLISSQLMSPLHSLADEAFPPGIKAPEFELPSNTGKSISLNDLKGKRTVLYFYPGDFTPYCTIEAQSFEKDFSKYKKLNTQIVGVSVDSEDMHLDFSKTYGLEFPLLSDQGGEVSKKYGGVRGRVSSRKTYIISPNSELEYVFTNVNPRIYEHSQDVLDKLSEIINKK